MSASERDRAAAEIRTDIAEAQHFLREAARTEGPEASGLRQQAVSRLKDARRKIAVVRGVVVESGKRAVSATDDYAQERPWTCIGIAAGVGVLLGMLISRRS